MPERRETDRREPFLPTSTLASVALHALIAVPVIFDLDLFGSRLDDVEVAFAVGMVPLSEVTAAPDIGEITPPRPLERLEEPAGNEAREVETVDAEAPEQAPTAEAAPEAAAAPPVSDEPLPEDLQPAEVQPETPPQLAAAEAPPPPALTQAPELPPEPTAEPAPAPPPALAEPDLPEQPTTPAEEAPQVAALESPNLPSEPQPEDRPSAPAVPAPPLPPERTQARVRTEPEPAVDEEDDEEPPVEADRPPAPAALPEQPEETQVAVLEPPPVPSFTPQRERAPEPPRPQTPVVDNTAEPPDQPSPVDTLLASLNQDTSAANSAQGTGSDVGSGGSSGSGNAQSGARLTGATLTLSEEEALRGQLARCWLLPAGASGVETMSVTIRAVMRPDRTVEGRAQIVDPQNRMASDPAFQAFAESAYRAVMTCQPLLLPPDRYADWSVLNLNFDPRNMF
ncbi:MAG: hypothetical protein R3F55_12170 [Alphaproteobacteria bacterium]